MSVYFYVTRNTRPFVKEDRRDITEAEWRAVIAADPDLAIEQPESSVGLPRNAVWAVWRAYPGGYPAWFALIQGDIEVKGIDEPLFGKLQQFATALNARIFCETGEEVT
ncbi:hypothetical protein ACXR0O_15160 [Verrucomicrobiota bacterium sgz303538]